VFTDNIAAFFRTTGHGVEATYTHGGAATTLNGIMDRDYYGVDPVGRAGVTSSQPRFTCATADLPSGAAAGDTITVAGSSYTVRVVEPDGTGVTMLILEAI